MEHHDDDFERFYAAAFGRIAGQLFVVTGDRQDAEDVTQEAFARASVRWSRLRTYDLPEAWVRRVALRLATDRFRQWRRLAAGRRALRAAEPGRHQGAGRGPGRGRQGQGPGQRDEKLR